jgi:hypothetical protein
VEHGVATHDVGAVRILSGAAQQVQRVEVGVALAQPARLATA